MRVRVRVGVRVGLTRALLGLLKYRLCDTPALTLPGTTALTLRQVLAVMKAHRMNESIQTEVNKRCSLIAWMPEASPREVSDASPRGMSEASHGGDVAQTQG